MAAAAILLLNGGMSRDDTSGQTGTNEHLAKTVVYPPSTASTKEASDLVIMALQQKVLAMETALSTIAHFVQNSGQDKPSTSIKRKSAKSTSHRKILAGVPCWYQHQMLLHGNQLRLPAIPTCLKTKICDWRMTTLQGSRDLPKKETATSVTGKHRKTETRNQRRFTMTLRRLQLSI